MTNIEQKALELVNEVEADRSLPQHTVGINREYTGDEALCRAIERHEAYKEEVEAALLDFRQEVSDAVEGYRSQLPAYLRRDIFDYQFAAFIIAKPDPLVEVIAELGMFPAGKDNADQLRAALAKRGLQITKL